VTKAAVTVADTGTGRSCSAGRANSFRFGPKAKSKGTQAEACVGFCFRPCSAKGVSGAMGGEWRDAEDESRSSPKKQIHTFRTSRTARTRAPENSNAPQRVCRSSESVRQRSSCRIRDAKGEFELFPLFSRLFRRCAGRKCMTGKILAAEAAKKCSGVSQTKPVTIAAEDLPFPIRQCRSRFH